MGEMGEVVQRLSHCTVTQAAYGAIHKTDSSTGRPYGYLEVRQMVVRLYETPPLPRRGKGGVCWCQKGLLKVLNATLEDLLVVVAVDVEGGAFAASFAVAHFAEHTAVGTGDALDGTVGAVHIVLLVHRRIAL